MADIDVKTFITVRMSQEEVKLLLDALDRVDIECHFDRDDEIILEDLKSSLQTTKC